MEGYIIGRWRDREGATKFIAWAADEPGVMHRMFTKWMLNGETVEILEYVQGGPEGYKHPVTNQFFPKYEPTSRIYRLRDALNKQEHNDGL
jgi:hypothetical protein